MSRKIDKDTITMESLYHEVTGTLGMNKKNFRGCLHVLGLEMDDFKRVSFNHFLVKLTTEKPALPILKFLRTLPSVHKPTCYYMTKDEWDSITHQIAVS